MAHNLVSVSVLVLGESAQPFQRQGVTGERLKYLCHLKARKNYCLLKGSKTKNHDTVCHILCGKKYEKGLYSMKLELRASAKVLTTVFCKPI